MNSQLFEGVVEHTRFQPVGHNLRYDMYVYAIDLEDLTQLDKRLPLFGYNRWRPVSLWDADYLDRSKMPLRRKLDTLISPYLSPESVDHAVLVTAPRYLGYAFNPVSFYFCYGADKTPVIMVAEVNNTFGERHAYVLPVNGAGGHAFPLKFTAEKRFHVSPFNDTKGRYRFVFNDIRENLDINITLEKENEPVLDAHLVGQARPLTAWQQLKTILRHPLLPHLTIPRIYKEAFKLKFAKKLFYYAKPVSSDPMTLRRNPPTLLERRAMALLTGYLERADRGAMTVQFPDGAQRRYGDPATTTAATLKILDYHFFPRIVLGADIGLGEAFMDGEWDSDDLVGVMRFFIKNRPNINDGRSSTSIAARAMEAIRHRAQRNTVLGSRKNIYRHYDLSNAFFQLFLDPSMAYSSAVFEHPGQGLEDAQKNKFHRIIRKARLTRSDHVLEIGCGWGGFAIEAVRRTGCRVTGITVSKAQHDLARERVASAGLSDRIDIRLMDYRHIDGRYDKIVSIEMLEAVGHEYYGRFFQRLDALLKPEGIAVIQSITIPDQHYERYRKESDWIRKHIFPGGHLPSTTILAETMTRRTMFVIEHLENIGNHYARTLALWRERFLANSDALPGLGFDEVFARKWLYYLSVCEAGFRERVLGDVQLVITREGNDSLWDLGDNT
jgi:cyclopropane-fatty-acyl-phospholipid synthase